jgi:hypothetical protein
LEKRETLKLAQRILAPVSPSRQLRVTLFLLIFAVVPEWQSNYFVGVGYPRIWRRSK